MFHVYAEAELKKLEAAGYHNDKGEPEYVVSVNGQALGNGLGLLQQLDGITGIRGTLFDDWFVISVEAGNDAALNVIKRAAFVEFVLPNRGCGFVTKEEAAFELNVKPGLMSSFPVLVRTCWADTSLHHFDSIAGKNNTARNMHEAAVASKPNNASNPHWLCTQAITGTADAITEKVIT